MSITMLHYESMGKNYPRKRIPGRGETKLRVCLGGCNKKFMTTVETRICDKCKRQNNDREEFATHSLRYDKSWKEE